MGRYLFRYIKQDNSIWEQSAECAEDFAALDIANLLLCEGEIEIWAPERFVARIRKKGESPEQRGG